MLKENYIDHIYLFMLWIIGGVLLGVVGALVTGHIPFFIPGVVVGLCGGMIHLLFQIRRVKYSWWQAGLSIAVLSMLVTVLLIPDARSGVIFGILSLYYLLVGTLLYLCCNKAVR